MQQRSLLQITNHSTSLSLSERVKNALDKQRDLTARIAQQQQCLLLDVSTSMTEPADADCTKFERLQELAAKFPASRKFEFSSNCAEVKNISAPDGSTNMARAFECIKRSGIKHAVLITDGAPDSESAALHEAHGLRLDILYVGPPPRPTFLEDLARVTGGSFTVTTLAQPQARKELTLKVTALLSAGGSR